MSLILDVDWSVCVMPCPQSAVEVYDLTPSVLCSDSDIMDGGFPDCVAMVMRGNCTFYEKVRLAQNNGAKGLLIVSKEWLVRILTSDLSVCNKNGFLIPFFLFFSDSSTGEFVSVREQHSACFN